MRYDKPKAGQWVKPRPQGYKLACCDCGLVHKMDFIVLHYHTAKRIPFAKVLFRVFRDNRATAAMRRGPGLPAGGRTKTGSVGGREKPARANRHSQGATRDRLSVSNNRLRDMVHAIESRFDGKPKKHVKRRRE